MLRFGLGSEIHLAALMDQGDGVIGAVEAYAVVGNVVDHDGVQALARAFFPGIVEGVVGFGGKPHHDAEP